MAEARQAEEKKRRQARMSVGRQKTSNTVTPGDRISLDSYVKK